MKKKTTEISINESSGAEKVERVEKEIKSEKDEKTTVKKTLKPAQPKSAKGEAALGGQAAKEVKELNARSTDGKAEQESQAAKARVEAALKRKEAQAKRKEERRARAAKKAEERKKRAAEKKAQLEKRAAEKKARAEKHAAERKALAEKRKAAREARLRERAHAKANRHNASYKKKKAKAKNKSERKQKSEREGRNKGYGGWIAAVVSLGVVSLALATTVTVGAVEMSKSKDMMMNAYKGTMYELTGIMENVGNDLDRVRVSNSPAQQSRILTDLLVQTRLAELDMEKLPAAAEADRNVTGFINRIAFECERMLGQLRRGEGLSERDEALLQSFYETSNAVQAELRQLTENMTDKELMGFAKEGMGSVKDALDRIEQSTLAENIKGLGEKGVPSCSEKGEVPRIEAAQAEAMCDRYFSGYNVGKFQCVGETVTPAYEAYNVQGYDERGNQLFAEISQRDGTLLRFDYYEECSGETFNLEGAEEIAEEFLEELGYDDMEVVRFRTNGSTTDFTFVYEEDGVAYYPDEILVKVCRTRGVVSGFDATKYVRSHRPRKEARVKVSLAQAQEKLHKGLQVEASRLAVIGTPRGERTAYEFLCAYGEERYFVFLDAVSGEEISIVNVKSIA